MNTTFRYWTIFILVFLHQFKFKILSWKYRPIYLQNKCEELRVFPDTFYPKDSRGKYTHYLWFSIPSCTSHLLHTTSSPKYFTSVHSLKLQPLKLFAVSFCGVVESIICKSAPECFWYWILSFNIMFSVGFSFFHWHEQL